VCSDLGETHQKHVSTCLDQDASRTILINLETALVLERSNRA